MKKGSNIVKRLVVKQFVTVCSIALLLAMMSPVTLYASDTHTTEYHGIVFHDEGNKGDTGGGGQQQRPPGQILPQTGQAGSMTLPFAGAILLVGTAFIFTQAVKTKRK